MQSIKQLTRQDATAILEIIHESLNCETENHYKKLIGKLKNLIPFDFAISGFAQTENYKLKSYNIINISYPNEWLERYVQKGYPRIDPIVIENFKGFNLQYWEDTYKRYNPPKEFIKEAEDFELKAGYTIGSSNTKRTQGSIFTISGPHLEQNKYSETILQLLAPHFHNIIVRINKAIQKDTFDISPREKEVLNWLKEGKSSWDISLLLKISENTVNFHIKNIIQKLDTVNRVQAVAVAFEHSIIEPD